MVEGRTNNYWINIRKKEDCLDVIIGKKYQPIHIHLGINHDMSIKFIEDRGIVKSIIRESNLSNGQNLLTKENERIYSHGTSETSPC